MNVSLLLRLQILLIYFKFSTGGNIYGKHNKNHPFITLENQQLYDGLIKKYIGTQISDATKAL